MYTCIPHVYIYLEDTSMCVGPQSVNTRGKGHNYQRSERRVGD